MKETLSQNDPAAQAASANQQAELSQTPRAIRAETEQAALEMTINNTNRNFKGQHASEIVYCFTRRHWIVILPHILGFLAVNLLLMAFFFMPSTNIAVLMASTVYRSIALLTLAGLTYYFHRFFIRLFNYYLGVIIITNFRILKLDKSVFFQDNKDSIDLKDMQDVVFQKNGLFKTILNYGELLITVAASPTPKIYTRIPNPAYYFKKINKTKRQYIARRREEKSSPAAL